MTIHALRAKIGTELGLGGWFSSFDGTAAAFEALSLEDKVNLTNGMRAYIRAHPEEFGSVAVTLANSNGGADLEAPDVYSITEAAGDFFGAVADEAVSINESVNPFSASNRKWFLGAAVGVAALYFLAPVIIQAIRAPSGASAK